jgi:hydrogenase maturation factor
VLPETRAICDALGADPLRLISSGALIIACPDGAAMAATLRGAGIEAAVIGEVTDRERLLLLPDGPRPAEPVWRDELWRILDDVQGPTSNVQGGYGPAPVDPGPGTLDSQA